MLSILKVAIKISVQELRCLHVADVVCDGRFSSTPDGGLWTTRCGCHDLCIAMLGTGLDIVINVITVNRIVPRLRPDVSIVSRLSVLLLLGLVLFGAFICLTNAPNCGSLRSVLQLLGLALAHRVLI